VKTRTEKHTFRIDSYNKRNAVSFLKKLSALVNSIPEDKRAKAVIVGEAYEDDEDDENGYVVLLNVSYQRDSTPKEIEKDQYLLDAYNKEKEEKERKELKRLLAKYPLTT
jgi:hypothetical protein